MRLLLILLLTLNLLQAKKIALLIGNSDYNFAPLANPLNDVDGIKNTLLEIGFAQSDITVLRNSSKLEMENALLNFEEKAQSAEIALIYFSGHGMQVENINYMFPAKTTATKPIHLKKLVDLDMFIQSASSAKYGIILVDACRNNPLVKYFQRGRHKGASAKKGLGQVTPKSGQVVIGFATSAGDTADDGNGDMSPYAKALSKRLKTPNKDITKVLGLVALDVSAKYNQNPIYRANLAYDVYLNNKSETIIIKDLMYQTSIKGFTFKNGKKYCENLNLAGYANWRLPTKYELIGLDSTIKFYKKNRREILYNFKNFNKLRFIDSIGDLYVGIGFLTLELNNLKYKENKYFFQGNAHNGKYYTICVRNDF